ncbi:laccase domain-containing protein 1 [Platysternon megacephalum]|uniref:Laccase domain-containing protein 1 n=1 Tax=Platysternon megacephalum TaxID=55544 RepID=A0A4D9EZA1_9SAUR|nr:laccase domain-containing protein 1 [Platysternon megacephalum]
MGALQLAQEGDRLLYWGAGVVTLLFTLLAAFMFRLLLDYLGKWKALKPIPGVSPCYPLLGNALLFERKGEDFFKQIVNNLEEYRNLPLLKLWIGPLPFVILYHPDAVEVVLNSSKHIEKSFPYKFLHPWLGTGLLTSEDGLSQSWVAKYLTKGFLITLLLIHLHLKCLLNVSPCLRVTFCSPYLSCSSYTNVFLINFSFLFLETAMGKNVSAQNNRDSEYVRAIYKMSDLIHHRQKSPWLWSNLMYPMFQEGREHTRSLKILHSFTDNVTCYSFFYCGHDTTAAAMNWAIYLLGCHPEAQKKVHRELDEVFGNSDRPVTMDDLKKLRYLECVVKEALRLFPSVPFFARTTSEDCHIRGFKIPKATEVVVVPYVLHREPEIFPDPEEFRPERFFPENSKGRHPYAYVPFSAGPRNCIGQRFAQMEEKAVLAIILRRFWVETSQEREGLGLVGELILRPNKGIWIQLKRRRVCVS